MSTRAPVVDAICWGNPREFGEQLGEALRERIAASNDSLMQFDAFRALQPWWMPFDWYQQWSERRAIRSLEPPIAKDFPRISQRLLGMADGAHVRLATLYLFHALESLAISSDQLAISTPAAACSAIAVPRQSSAEDHTILAHNLDGVDLFGHALVLRENRSEGQYRTLGISCAPLSGLIDGVNEQGLAITYNWAFSNDNNGAAAPISMAIDDALANCRTVNEAVRRISRQRRCGGAMLMLADAAEDVAALELSNQRFRVRRPRNRRPLFHSNQYRCRSMQSAQVARGATFAYAAPPGLKGRRVLQSPERRDHRLRRLLRARRLFSHQSLTELLADHGKYGWPGDDTICMHGRLWTTQACIQIAPKRRSFQISYGPACEARLVEFTL